MRHAHFHHFPLSENFCFRIIAHQIRLILTWLEFSSQMSYEMSWVYIKYFLLLSNIQKLSRQMIVSNYMIKLHYFWRQALILQYSKSMLEYSYPTKWNCIIPLRLSPVKAPGFLSRFFFLSPKPIILMWNSGTRQKSHCLKTFFLFSEFASPTPHYSEFTDFFFFTCMCVSCITLV